MIVSWVTVDEPGFSKVIYWSAKSKKKIAGGKFNTYKYSDYSSPYIHHVTIRNLKVYLTCFRVSGFFSFLFFFLVLSVWDAPNHVLGFADQMIKCRLSVWIILRLNHLCMFTVQHQILLWGWNWTHNAEVLVCNSSASWARCSLHFWSNR